MFVLALSWTFESTAAQEPSRAEGAATAPAATGEAAPLVITLPWTAPSGQGVGLSYDNGAYGQFWEQSLKFALPITPFFVVNIRPMLLMQITGTGAPQGSIGVGGRVELIGRTPVFLNLIRIYGGGGGGPFVDVAGPQKGQVTAEGGGEFGFEFFLQPHFSFYSEIGGNGCGVGTGLCSGATVVAGLTWYP
jgi:hypothetical protein